MWLCKYMLHIEKTVSPLEHKKYEPEWMKHELSVSNSNEV